MGEHEGLKNIEGQKKELWREYNSIVEEIEDFSSMPTREIPIKMVDDSLTRIDQLKAKAEQALGPEDSLYQNLEKERERASKMRNRIEELLLEKKSEGKADTTEHGKRLSAKEREQRKEELVKQFLQIRGDYVHFADIPVFEQTLEVADDLLARIEALKVQVGAILGEKDEHFEALKNHYKWTLNERKRTEEFLSKNPRESRNCGVVF